jgi:hypothetical protein
MAIHKRRIGRILAAAVITGSLLALAPASAHADGADVTHDVFEATDSVPFVNACTGVTGTAHISFKGVSHLTVRANEPPNAVSFTNLTGDFTFVPDDPTLGTATGHFTSIDVGAGGVNAALNTVLNIQGTTTDGTRVHGHVMFHLTENGLGVIVVDFEKAVCN